MEKITIAGRYSFHPIQDKLGSGGFSTAYKAIDSHRNRTVVLKIFDKPSLAKFDIIHEIQKVENIVHPNLIRYYDAFLWETTDAFNHTQSLQIGVMEYANGGTFAQLIKDKIPLPLFEKLMDDVMNGLQALHHANVLHLDLKPENIFIHESEDGQRIAKIGDFGISRVLGSNQQLTTTMSMVTGTPDYIAPEIIFRKKYGINGNIGLNADLWSLGVMVLKYFTGKSWVQHSGTAGEFLEVLATELEKGIDLNLKEIPLKWQICINACLQPYAAKRPAGIKELKNLMNEGYFDPEATAILTTQPFTDKKDESDKKDKETTNISVQEEWKQSINKTAASILTKIKTRKWNKKPVLWIAAILMALWVLKAVVYEPWKEARALKRIEAAGLKLNVDDFIKVIKENNINMVQNYLNAGMDVNAKDNDGYTPLRYAAINNYIEIVKLLLKNGADVNPKNNGGWNILKWVVVNGYDDIMKMLIKKELDVNEKLEDEKTFLMIAADSGYTEIARLLVEKGADVNTKDKWERTSLMYAVEKGHTDIARFLIEKGADLNAKGNYGFNYGNTALMRAASNGHTDVARLLIEKGADVNAKDNDGKTALMYAAYNGHTDVARLLIEKGADMNAKDNYGTTALMWARSPEVAKLLIEKGVDVNAKNNYGTTALMWAASFGTIDLVRFLIEKGADVNAKSNIDETVLMHACENGHLDVARLLIEKGADVNTKDSNRKTALMLAASNGHTDVASLLIEKGADVNAKDKDGWTALMYAAYKGHTDVARLLIEKGSDVNAKDDNGETALMSAVDNNHTDVARLLIEKGANVNARNKNGENVLFMLTFPPCRMCSIDIDLVKFLIEHGVDINAKNKLGSTYLMEIVKGGYGYIAELLLEKGADVNAKDNDGRTALSIAKSSRYWDIVNLLEQYGARE